MFNNVAEDNFFLLAGGGDFTYLRLRTELLATIYKMMDFQKCHSVHNSPSHQAPSQRGSMLSIVGVRDGDMYRERVADARA